MSHNILDDLYDEEEELEKDVNNKEDVVDKTATSKPKPKSKSKSKRGVQQYTPPPLAKRDDAREVSASDIDTVQKNSMILKARAANNAVIAFIDTLGDPLENTDEQRLQLIEMCYWALSFNPPSFVADQLRTIIRDEEPYFLSSIPIAAAPTPDTPIADEVPPPSDKYSDYVDENNHKRDFNVRVYMPKQWIGNPRHDWWRKEGKNWKGDK